MKKERIQYIDALRGFTMLLVVFSHVELFGFFEQGGGTALSKIFMLFRMPLFFFISGYISFKSEDYIDIKNLVGKTWYKAKIQIIPTLIFGLLYSCSISNHTFQEFLFHPQKYGFWFTISLLEMFILYYLIRMVSLYFKKLTGNYKEIYPILLVLFSGVTFLTKGLFYKGMPFAMLGDIACVNETFKYFHFFAAGILASKYNKVYINFINNKYILASLIIAFLFGSTYNYEYGTNRVLNTIFEVIPRYSGLLIVYAFYYKYQSSFQSTTCLGKCLQYIGRRTLDIYLLHYFFIPDLSFVGDFIKTSPNYLVELLCGMFFTVCVVAVSLIISNVLRLSPLLGRILFGVKQENDEKSVVLK